MSFLKKDLSKNRVELYTRLLSILITIHIVISLVVMFFKHYDKINNQNTQAKWKTNTSHYSKKLNKF